MPRLQLATHDAHLNDDDRPGFGGRLPPITGDTPPGGLLEVIPIPETGQVMVITAHLLPAADVGTPATVPGLFAHPVTGPQGAERETADLVVERDARRVWVDGKEVTLTFQEFELLDYLTARPGKVFSRIHLMNAVWEGAAVVVPRTVDVHVHRLRRKLGRHGRRLVTVRRVGYCYRLPEAEGAAPR
ncbi:winged helix-turn-helix domain-containing protein [Actinoallomurus purpureus]|uniref:winged helix-turn-helix domain-containing protein n=1 Tax=Actinoallomurus purpureus TaxID=478114 RepID=UPI002093C0A1|nr:winged helix-turn-helix domain-containing protein [Actinoallomurus purpureus]MCO6010354.1 winged helix-turn-helix domain-containing protein [Actinoallomurus purpureus]